MKSFLRSFSSLLLNHSRRVVVSNKRKYVHEVLVSCLFKLEVMLSVTSESMCTKYWLTACSSLPRKKCG